MAVFGVLLLSGVVLGQLQSLTFGKTGIGDLSPGGLAELGIKPSSAAEKRSPERQKCSESDPSNPVCQPGRGVLYGTPEDYYDGVDTGAATRGVDYNWRGGKIVNNTLEELLLCECGMPAFACCTIASICKQSGPRVQQTTLAAMLAAPTPTCPSRGPKSHWFWQPRHFPPTSARTPPPISNHTRCSKNTASFRILPRVSLLWGHTDGELDERCKAKLIEDFPAIEAYRARPTGTFRALTALQSCPPRETSSSETRLGPDGLVVNLPGGD